MNISLKNLFGAKVETQRHDASATLRTYAHLPRTELFTQFDTNAEGLTFEQVEQKRHDFGENLITSGVKNTSLHRLREAVINPFNIILLIIAVIALFTDIIWSPDADYATVIIILALVAISSFVAFIQSERSSKAAEQLSQMISNKADVWRDGSLVEIPMDELVPGDIVRLSAGDMLPADVRFLTTKDTFVAQSTLTGESQPVEKFSSRSGDEEIALTDLPNMGLMGSNIVSGSATAIALATGNHTYLGTMAESLSGNRAKNSFERGVDSVSKLLLRMMLVMVPVVFIVNGLSKGDWASSLLFSISIAVGLTPEMLPVIMTSTLARGAVSMSKHDVIVRNLSAIQTFGEMDVLCTDKTGTLTEDKIILEKYMNLQGDHDPRILRHAFLNSYFQTGLKNLIDEAIISRAKQKGLGDILGSYEHVDEIPFDFTRRRMSVVLENTEGKRQLITKGAVEEIMAVSSFIEMNGSVVPLNDESRRIALETYNVHNTNGLRMLAIAQKNEVPGSGSFSVADESDMVLIGFVGFLDPPKESSKAAIDALREHGVRTVVLTGDSEGVAAYVCEKVGVDTTHLLSGVDVDAMDDDELLFAIGRTDLFAKLSPSQKKRIVAAFQSAGHTIGYMGDGINDALAIQQADVGISVDNAVDIAKETADIILLKKDLMVLEQGVLEGRRTFGNIVKYIKMAASGNFGNMFSVMVASVFLPFLPMLPIQILTQNLLTDLSQMGIPFDTVDESYVKKPRKWDTDSIKTFMIFLGPLSSVFDILCFAVMWWVIGANTKELAPLFQAGWFVFGTVSQVLIVHAIRTEKIPFLRSRPSTPLLVSTFIVAAIAVVVGFSHFAIGLDMMSLPFTFVPWLIAIVAGYIVTVEIAKVFYIRKYGEWI